MSNCCNTKHRHDKTTTTNRIDRAYVPAIRQVVVACLAVVAIGTAFYLIGVNMIPGTLAVSTAEASVTPIVTGSEVTFPESTFTDGKARFFEYKTSDGKIVRYFIIKSSDGVIRAAFDACDVCWESGKGYKQKDDLMVCQNCGRRFQSTKVNVVTGGCNPSALTRTVRDGKVVITAQALNEGRRLFK
jgi:uncharacterized membrane protein